jgi:thioredoxin 2
VSDTASIVRCPSCGAKNRVPAVSTGIPRCGRCQTPLPWSADADDATFVDVVERSSLPVLLDLWAPWCGPCRVVSPMLEQLAVERAGRLKLVKVNVDDAPGVGARFSAQSIPTLLVLRGEEVVARQVGAAPIDRLRTWLDSALETSEARPG